MSHEIPIVVPHYTNQTPAPVERLVEDPAATHPMTPPTPEQIQAMEAAVGQEQESQTVAGLLGVWTGTMLLKDLADEHFQQPLDEEDVENKPRPEDEA